MQPFSDRQLLTTKLLTSQSSRPTSLIVCGPKNSGKSTFCRMLVNAMLTRHPAHTYTSGTTSIDNCVALVDLDPGQPEYSPPGELSLILMRSCILGPPFTHPMVVQGSGNTLVRAHHVGSISPRDDPSYYVKCALDLLNQYRKLITRYPSCPLIVNSAGWVQGIGLEVLLDIIKAQKFNDVVYTSTRGPEEDVGLLKEVAELSGACVHFLDSQKTQFITRTASDLRQMQSMSYFHLDEPELDNLRWNVTPLTEHLPLIVHWAGVKQALFAIIQLIDFINPEDLLMLLDCSIVGLVVLEDKAAMPEDTKNRESCKTDALPEQPAGGKTDCFASARMQSSSDSDSDSESLASSISSNLHGKQISQIATAPSTDNASSGDHLNHPSVLRNSMGMPYLASRDGIALVDPSRSYSLGQALIRGIDTKSKCFQLLTPVPWQILKGLHEQKRRIVLVKGNLGTPGWAFQEEWERGAALRQWLRKEHPDDADIMDAEDGRECAERNPYVSATDRASSRSATARVWSRGRSSDLQESDYDSDEFDE